MEPLDAVREVLRDAGEPLHWTVVQDRALRQGLVDPFVVRDVRKAVLSALAELVGRGEAEKLPKGVYSAT